MNVSNLATKAMGAAALGMVLYDSNYAGAIESRSYQRKSNADSVTDVFMENMALDRPSIVQSKLRNKYLKFKMDENFTDFFEIATGYVKGFSSMLVNNVVPFGLSLGALATKGIVSKTFGVGLLGYGIVYLLQDVMNFGGPRGLKDIKV